MRRTYLTTFLFAAMSITLVSCEKGESDDLAKAQECLDNVSESRPADADECMNYVEKYSSQQASILKCSILITSGGLMETKITKGYKILKDDTQSNKTASFMAVLSLDKPNINAGYTKAKKANEFCEQSGVTGLMYLSNIVVAGTYLAKTMNSLGITGLDPSDPSSVETAVNALLADCAGATPSAACSSDSATLGNSVMSLAGSYCSTPSADDSVCGEITQTIEQSGGSANDVGLALLCILAEKDYNSTTKQCE